MLLINIVKGLFRIVCPETFPVACARIKIYDYILLLLLLQIYRGQSCETVFITYKPLCRQDHVDTFGYHHNYENHMVICQDPIKIHIHIMTKSIFKGYYKVNTKMLFQLQKSRKSTLSHTFS